MDDEVFVSDIARHVWDTKYRYRQGSRDEVGVRDTWRRVAAALAGVETEPAAWSDRFYGILDGFLFLPGGRILAGAGTGHEVTLFNCFVMGLIDDSIDGIFDALKEGALTMQQGGGVGYDFSTLRPAGSRARRTGTTASGPVSFMHIWDAMCGTILSTGARRGAMMATLRCDHPDIETFVRAKHDPAALRRFNISVQISDAFMQAVERDRPWPLVFPEAALDGESGERVMREWPGSEGAVPCRVMRTLPARELWNAIMESTYAYAEPGVLFVDRVNQWNNLSYRERISATNPCGEIPLPPYGACDLGSVNLTRFVVDAFGPDARLDLDGIRDTVTTAVRLMDNVIDVSRFPLEAQAEQARGTRRIGMGMTGLADALIMLGLRYDSGAARAVAGETMRMICHTAYRGSVALAREKGPFPFFAKEEYLSSPFVHSLPEDVREGIARYGIRNGLLTAIAPTGTISLLANNVSSGIEPVFDFSYTRRVLDAEGRRREHHLTDSSLLAWRARYGDAPLPDAFVDAAHLDPEAHLAMQAAVQPYVDNAISKTINVPASMPFETFRDIYETAYRYGLKGCTTFRPNPVTGAVLEGARIPVDAGCCGIEREGD